MVCIVILEASVKLKEIVPPQEHRATHTKTRIKSYTSYFKKLTVTYEIVLVFQIQGIAK